MCWLPIVLPGISLLLCVRVRGLSPFFANNGEKGRCFLGIGIGIGRIREEETGLRNRSHLLSSPPARAVRPSDSAAIK